jgi:RNA polymerase sigma factor (sigma-70 family)
MQLLSPNPSARPRCERIHRIETGYDTSAAPANRDDGNLAFLLKRAAAVRERDPFEHQRIVEQIIRSESRHIRYLVAIAGVRQTGRRWVDVDDVEDVTSAALMRVSKFLDSMRGSSVGEFYVGVKSCVRYAVADHVRGDSRIEELPVDHGHFTDALSPEETQYAELAGLAATNSAEDRAEFKERVSVITKLEPRAAEVVKLRGIEGVPSKEVAEQLGLTVANVDQIFRRSLEKIAGLVK